MELIQPQDGIVVLLYHLIFFFYCDYFYQSSGTHYARRGDSSNSGFSSGAFYVNLNTAYNYNIWHFGANLSFKIIVIILIKVVVLDIQFEVVDQVLIIVVEYFV